MAAGRTGPRGLALFLLQPGHGATPPSPSALAAALPGFGFALLASGRREPGSSAHAAAELGALAACGFAYALALDALPQRPAKRLAVRYRGLDNARLERAQRRLRRSLARATGARLLVTRNAETAARLAEALLPEGARLLAEARQACERFATRPQGRLLAGSVGLRAALELVDGPAGPRVRKTAKPGFAGYLARELSARRELGGRLAAVDPALAGGEDFVELPLYRALPLPSLNGLRLLPVAHARAALGALEELYRAGYAHLDGNPGSLVYDAGGRPKLIDFEYLLRYDARPASFEEGYDIAGPPPDYDGPGAGIAASFTSRWQEWIGLDYEQIRRDPSWVQGLRRLGYRLTGRLPRLLSRPARDGLRWARDWILALVRSRSGTNDPFLG
ncbi:MAG: hypothetical protein ACREDZ_12925 [Kiloniellales bacterium]